MAAFAVISLIPSPMLGQKIEAEYPGASLPFSPSAWFVAASGVTTQEICTKLGIVTGGAFSNAIVLKVDSYFGLASKNIWEWLAVKGAGP